MRFGGRVALVTGAGGHGIGRATAIELARNGAAVAVNDVREEGVQKVVAEIEEVGGRAVAVVGDVCSVADVDRMVATVEDEVGPVDILVNNAAANPRGAPMDEFRHSDPLDLMGFVEGNVGTAMICTRAVINGMIDRGYGKVVCISSVAAVLGAHRCTGYAAGKAALDGFVASVAKEVAPFGVNINIMRVGNAYTPGRPQSRVDLLNEWNHFHRMGRPEEFARTILFLASDDASYLSGSTVVCDGGTEKFAVM